MLAVLCLAIWILTRIWMADNKHYFHLIWIIDLLTVGMLVSDTLALVYRGNVTTQGYYLVRIANFANFFFLYMMTFCMSYFVFYIFEVPKRGRRRILIARILAAAAILSILVNLFIPFAYGFDEQNRYYRKTGWYFNAAGQLIAIVLVATVVNELRNEVESSVFWMVLVDMLMPLIASVVQIFIYGISITNIAIGATQVLLFMIVCSLMAFSLFLISIYLSSRTFGAYFSYFYFFTFFPAFPIFLYMVHVLYNRPYP